LDEVSGFAFQHLSQKISPLSFYVLLTALSRIIGAGWV
jgi:hypothetical protein